MSENISKVALQGTEEATNSYRFQTVWWTSATVEKIWEIMATYAAWPTWWRGVKKVKVVRRGDESGVGTVLRQGWRSWLPYTLVFDLEMTRLDSKRVLEGRASGDLEGICKWTFAPLDGGTRSASTWTSERVAGG